MATGDPRHPTCVCALCVGTKERFMTTDTEDLPAIKQNNCFKCGWPLTEHAKDGCTVDNCSQRPLPKVFDDGNQYLQGPPPNEAIERLDESQGHTPGNDPDGPPLLTAEQVNALKAQVEFCQSYIVFVEKKLELFLGGTDKAIELDKRVELAVVGWRIIQDENANLKAEKEVDAMCLSVHHKAIQEMTDRLTAIIPGWSGWSDFGQCLKVYEDDQRSMREDNANQAATIARLELENRALDKELEKACDHSD